MGIFTKKWICILLGHKPVPMLIETEYGIYGKGCKRCKQPLCLPDVWKNIPPPPNSNSEQLASWHQFMNEKIVEKREEIKKQENDFKNFNES